MPRIEQPPPSRYSIFFRFSIGGYLFLLNVILLGLLFPALSMIFFHEVSDFQKAQLNRAIQTLRLNLENRAASLTHSAALSAAQALAGFDFTFLNTLLGQLQVNNTDIGYCMVMDRNRKIIAHSDPGLIGATMAEAEDIAVATLAREAFADQADADVVPRQVRFLDRAATDVSGGSSTMESIAPVYVGRKLAGVLRCNFSLKTLSAEALRVKQEWAVTVRQAKTYFFTICGVFFLVAVAIAAIFTSSLTRSVRNLNRGVNLFASGALAGEIRQDGMVCTEINDLTIAFNDMTARLRASYRQLDEYSKSLERMVEERTRELREAQANLLSQAHEAGMAEMAVGILHNIGNAITPAKVGAAMLTVRVRDSALRNQLTAPCARIRQALAHPGEVQEEDRNRLLQIIDILPSSIREEYDSILDALKDIREKHEHIEGIISLQLRYAKLFGDAVLADLNSLAEDALKMLADSLEKRSIDVVKRFGVVPPVRIEQAKLVQIIVNLIKNAYEAMEETDPGRRRLELVTGIAEGTPPLVLLSIRDSGCGFSPGEQEQFFKFGFTTKSRGSGFGLHSCANYLTANHGSITARSDGPGAGAEFTIRLPAVESGNVG